MPINNPFIDPTKPPIPANDSINTMRWFKPNKLALADFPMAFKKESVSMAHPAPAKLTGTKTKYCSNGGWSVKSSVISAAISGAR